MATYVDLSTLHTPTPRSKPPSTWGAQIRENFEFLNSNRRQICTNATRPTGFEGLEIYETDTNSSFIYDGAAFIEFNRLAAWSAHTPTITQSGTVTHTVTHSQYTRQGRLIVWSFVLAITGSGTGANAISITLPVTAVTGNNMTVGTGSVFDVSGPNLSYSARCVLNSTTALRFSPTDGTAGGFLGSSLFTAALASGDSIDGTVTYQASA